MITRTFFFLLTILSYAYAEECVPDCDMNYHCSDGKCYINAGFVVLCVMGGLFILMCMVGFAKKYCS